MWRFLFCAVWTGGLFGHILSITPSETTVGAPGFTLRAVGVDFEFTETLKWNGVALATTYVSSEELHATVPASLLLTPGPVTISLSSSGYGGGYPYYESPSSPAGVIFTIHPEPVITTTSPLPGAGIAERYSRTLARTGGTPPFRWTVASGSLPPGISLDTNSGLLAGVTTSQGSFRFTVRLTDRVNIGTTKDFVLSVTTGGAGSTEPGCAVTPRNQFLSMHHPAAHVAGGPVPQAPDHILRVQLTTSGGSNAPAGTAVRIAATRSVFAGGSTTANGFTAVDGVASFVILPPAAESFDRTDFTAKFDAAGKTYECRGSILVGIGLLSSIRESISATSAAALLGLRNQYAADSRRFLKEAEQIVEQHAEFQAEALALLEYYEPQMQTALSGGDVHMKPSELARIEKFLLKIQPHASADFRAAIGRWRRDMTRIAPAKIESANRETRGWDPSPFVIGVPPTNSPEKHRKLSFESNAGQVAAAKHIRFLARGAVHHAWFTNDGVVLRTPLANPVTLRFAGATLRDPELLEPTGAMTNYLVGSDPRAWRTGIPHHARLRYREVFPGADLVFYGDEGQLRYDFVLRPGANPRKVVVAFDGIGAMEPQPSGELLLQAKGGVLRLGVPYVYQLASNGTHRPVAARYRSRGGNRIGFELDAYDPSLPVVIDPVVQYSSFAGSSGEDAGLAVRADAQGSAYVAGFSGSSDIQAFVTKFSPDGSRIIYTTYLGGSGIDIATGLALDRQGNVYICGSTSSTDFPAARGFGPSYGGGPSRLLGDGFVVKLDASGSSIVYGSYLGGSGGDAAKAIAVDEQGSAYITGYTASLDFPMRGALQPVNRGGEYLKSDAFVVKVNPAGTALEYATYLGGNGDDAGLAVTVDNTGNAYVAGATHSPNFPVANAFQNSRKSDVDAFVVKLNPAGNALIYSTYFGGSSDDSAAAIAVDSSGAVYIAGITGSVDLPAVQSNAAQSKPGSADGLGFDAFAAKLSPAGNTVLYSTFLGGSGTEMAQGIAVDANGAAYVVGETGSSDYPVTNRLWLAGAGSDSFLTKLNSSGTAMEFSTYLGGQSLDSAAAVALDTAGNVYVAGSTASSDLPVTTAAARSVLAGRSDAFAIKIQAAGVTPPLLDVRSAASQSRGGYAAPDSVLTILGDNLAANEMTSQDPQESLGGIRVEIVDREGASRSAAIYSASPTRIDAVVPADVALGATTVRVLREGAQQASVVASGSLYVAAVAPGIFTENGAGTGSPRGWAVRASNTDGVESLLPLSQCSGSNGDCEPLELDLSSGGVTLTLLATGMRRQAPDTVVAIAGGEIPVPVITVKPHAQYPGYDQIVLGPLPLALQNRGLIDLALSVGAEKANVVRIRVK